jgi:branched-chain amino acid transport system ATP-binding protein
MTADEAKNQPPILQVNQLTKFYGGLAAVKDVSFEVRRGQIFGFIGPNGAGKTTLFNLIAGAQEPTSGQVLCRGKDITGLPAFRLVQKGIARTHQIVRPFRTLTVLQNVKVGSHFGRHGVGHTVASENAIEVLRAVGLQDLADTPAYTLSVGQQKKLEVARALATGPDILLCDEICGGLTHAETYAMLDLLREIRRRGTTIMYVEHDVKAITAVCDRILVLNYGQKLAEGTPQEIQLDPAVIEAYIGAAPKVINIA